MYSPFSLPEKSKSPGPIKLAEILFQGSGKREQCNLLIDTGAGRSALPQNFLENDLEATPCREISFGDFDGSENLKKSYIVNIKIDGVEFPHIEVIGTAAKLHGLLGRDILTRYFLRYDGPKQKFELDFCT